MCTMIAHQAKIEGRGKNGQDWFEFREANVSYDHPVRPAARARAQYRLRQRGRRTRRAGRGRAERRSGAKTRKTIEAVLAQADQRGVLEDRHQAPCPLIQSSSG